MSKDIFEANEYSLLLDILTIKNDKRKFNLKYNNLIKLIRKNINRINNKNKGD
jgi:predicted component of type VI protein secretion system